MTIVHQLRCALEVKIKIKFRSEHNMAKIRLYKQYKQ